MLSKTKLPIEPAGAALVAWIAERFAPHGVTPDDFAVTLHMHEGDGGPVTGSFAYRGNVPFYPCSVIKMFYMVALQQAYEDGRLTETPELARALHDMIMWSSNMATNFRTRTAIHATHGGLQADRQGRAGVDLETVAG